MKYKNIIKGKFIKRPNRFIAHVDINGIETVTHVKNTGRCKELLLPDATVILEKSDNPARKTAYDLVSVYKEGLGLINMDSQAPNKLVMEWLSSSKSCFGNPLFIRPEFTYGDSRIDFYLEYEDKRALIEVKGVTLEIDGEAYFPDAPTARGTKHLRELTRAVENGYEAYICFVIQMPGIKKVHPNQATDPEFTKAYYNAINAGVKVLTLECNVNVDEVIVNEWGLT